MLERGGCGHSDGSGGDTQRAEADELNRGNRLLLGSRASETDVVTRMTASTLMESGYLDERSPVTVVAGDLGAGIRKRWG